MTQQVVRIKSIKHVTHDVLQIITEKTLKHTFTPGQATEGFLKDYVKDPQKNIYVCGPPAMMEAIEKQLANLRIGEKLIIKEVF